MLPNTGCVVQTSRAENLVDAPWRFWIRSSIADAWCDANQKTSAFSRAKGLYKY